MDVIQEYIHRHVGCVIMICGLPLEYSNHHVLAAALMKQLRDKLVDADIDMVLKRIDTTNDIPAIQAELTSFDGLMVISSNVLVKNTIEPDFLIYIDTSLEVLAQRGFNHNFSKEDANWEQLKKEVNIDRFVNDYTPSVMTKPTDITSTNSAWKCFFALWSSLMRLVAEKLHKEDIGKIEIIQRSQR